MPRPWLPLVLISGLAAATVSDPAPARSQTLPRPAFKSIGVGGCAASGCHGGGDRVGTPGSEFTTWATADPHSRAYSVLLTDLGQRMTRLYRRDATADAGKDTLCLKCHAPAATTDATFRSDGVGCESCHGPAEAWRTIHYLASWKTLDESAKSARGMIATKNLVGRVRACAACHVGEPGMDVDHDLIAAGHPRLTFEYAAYHDIYPKHWVEPGGPAFSAKSWAVGRVVTAAAATRLIADRARANRWPELADLNCYSCHRGLTGEPTDTATRPIGSLGGNDWAFAGLGSVADLGPAFAPPQSADPKPLLDLMRRPNTPPGKIAEAASLLHTSLNSWATQLEKAPWPDVSASQALFSKVATAPASNWDQAAQSYLALAALHRSLPNSDARRQSLARVRDSLSFPHGFNSPSGFSLGRFQAALQGVAP